MDILSRVSEVLIENGVTPEKVDRAVSIVRGEFKSHKTYVRAKPPNFDLVVTKAFNETPDTRVIAKRFSLARSTVYKILNRNRKCHSQ
ncbi:hypothetical protein W03_09910 [Nitrosomonas sp. PY1]|nr:hypothetical protein W03_09910 [Nitrosomonas sp. PY1]